MLAIDPDQPKIVHLLDKTVLRDNWLIKFEKDRKPGTIKAYLGALHRFYAFSKDPVPTYYQCFRDSWVDD